MTKDHMTASSPPILYHYTDAGGLQGILGPGQGPYIVEFPDEDMRMRHRNDHNLYTNGKAALFRATDIRFMNDSTELVFGARVVNDRLTKASADLTLDPALRSAFAAAAAAFNPERVFDWPFRCFAACFCEDGDLLSQWRGYAGGVGGFSIGFPHEVLKQFSYGIHVMAAGNMHDLPVPATLVQVSYGEEEAGNRADQMVEAVTRAFRAGALLLDLDRRPTLFTGLAAFRAIAGMKHSAFQEEREWRLVTVTESGRQVRTRSRPSGMTPYTDVVVNARLSGEHGPDYVSDAPLAKVVVGPTASPAAQILAVRDLLTSRGMWGFRDVPVVSSTAPFRS